MSGSNGARPARTVVVTGGAGFIGTNLAHRLALEGDRVIVYDDLSRPGVDRNLRWLRSVHPERIEVEVAGVTEPLRLRRVVERADAVFHLAAQVAVTTSIDDPAEDFSVNLRGTMNLLEALRRMESPPHLVFTSTNKVYGRLARLRLEEGPGAYRPRSTAHRRGVREDHPLAFHSPYGCSKGAADQYVLDYARTFGLPATVFRMSCIYGPHQHGTEDQGWVAHFMIRAFHGRPVTIFGDGKQVRDILYVSDLIDAFLLALEHREAVVGRPFNIGGGPENAVSLLEVADTLAELGGVRPELRFSEWRRGDQRWYVSDTTSFRNATGWAPGTGKRTGLERLFGWLRDNLDTELERGAPAIAVAG